MASEEPDCEDIRWERVTFERHPECERGCVLIWRGQGCCVEAKCELLMKRRKR